MSNQTLALDDRLYDYLLGVSLREDPILARLRAETSALPEANMQIAPEQGQFMALLAKLMGARRCLEVGTFTGYSALAIAQALPADGQLIALDVSEQWTSIARRYWAEAGVAERIDLRLGPAADTMHRLLDTRQGESFDFIFVDADKTGYRAYCGLALELLRPGGLLLLDNVLWGGRVIDPAINDPDTRAIRELNEWLCQEERVDLSLVPIGDGLTLARKLA
jgi:predicted O-methyltransferase YrrM